MRRISRHRSHPMINWPILIHISGWLLIIESIFMLFPTVTCIINCEDDWKPFAGATLLTAMSGYMASHFVRPRSMQMGKREGYLLTAMVWVIFSLFGLIPFLFCTRPWGFTDAFFEAMSGFTTTGASVVSCTALSSGVQLWRAMMQWIGGMGIILFTLAVIPMLNHSGGMQMFNAEVTGITHEKIQPRISQTAKTLWLIYICLTILLIALLYAGPMGFFDSLCQAFGTISTGGFSNNYALIDSSAYVKAVLTLFMFLGGVNFSMIFKLLRGDFSAVRHNDVFRAYVRVLLIGAAVFLTSIIVRGSGGDWLAATVDSLFQSVSVCTSTGYSVADFGTWGAPALAVTFVMMFFGACAGSTSGGAKIDRALFLYQNSRNELYRCIYPNNILSVKINGRVMGVDIVNKVIAFLCLYLLMIVAGGFVLSLFNVPLVDAFFSSFSCLSNTGFGAGITGYGTDYDVLPDAAKWVLAFQMLVGRLEIFTVLLLFTPVFWRR